MYEKGLHELGDDLFAYLQPDGGWGWSNAGLIAAEGASLLVDTLFDLPLTRAMLDTMAPVTRRRPISTLVNTHANGDHCYGNQLVEGASIVASSASAAEMDEVPPSRLSMLLETDLGAEANAYIAAAFGPFAFDGIDVPPVDRTFDERLELEVGGRVVELIEVGPAHTAGDVLAHVPDANAMFTGDILFVDGTPIIWNGPVSNWVAACDLMLSLELAVIVPGHGPLTDDDGVRATRDYLTWLEEEARTRHAAGQAVVDAAFDIDLGAYADWGESERVVLNLDAIYRELDPGHEPLPLPEAFTVMQKLLRR